MGKKCLKFLQNNAHKSSNATTVLKRVLVQNKIDILFIQEPQTNKKGEICGLPNANLVFKTGVNVDERPRSGLWLEKRIEHFPLSKFLSRDVAAAKIKAHIGNISKEVVVCSAYFASDVNSIPPELESLIQFCHENRFELIIACDANAHHTVWGNDNCNPRGDMVLEFILSNDLVILNNGNKPTYYRTGVRSIIDLTLISRNLRSKLSNWRVTEEVSGSDHVQIEFEWKEVVIKVEQFRQPQKTDWVEYNKLLHTNVASINCDLRSIAELDNCVNLLTKGIINAYHNSCPLLTRKSHTDKKWWNNYLEKLRKEVNHKWNIAPKKDKSKTKYNCSKWRDYFDCLTKYNNEKKKAIQKSFDRNCQAIDNVSSASRMYKFISKNHSNNLGSLRKNENDFTSNETESLKLLADVHFPGSSIVYEDRIDMERNPVFHFTGSSECMFTKEAIKWAVMSFKSYKSSGYDEIFPALLQKGIECLVPILQAIFIHSHMWGYIPILWRKVVVRFIPKGGRLNANDPKSFRPISLTSFLQKSMEKILDRQIRDKIEVDKPLNKNQYAYQEGKCTTHAIQSLVTRVRKVFKDQEFSINAFIDIEGAFNNLNFLAIKNELMRRRIDVRTVEWIMNMLSKRYVNLSLGNETLMFKVTKGCPQGGVLSPLLWCLVADTLIERLTEQGFKVEGFADDIVFGVSGICPETVSLRIGDGLRVVEDWCLEIGLSANPAKTVLVPFTQKRNYLDKLKKPRFFKKEIDYSFGVKYLGMKLDTKLLMKDQLDFITNRAITSLYTCKAIIGKTWGMNPKMIRWMYQSITIPSMTNNAVVWYKKMDLRNFQEELSRVQRIACLMISGCFRTTPTAALEVMLDLPPIHTLIRAEARITNYRMSISCKPEIRKLKDAFLSDQQEEQEIFRSRNADYMTPRFNFVKNYSIEIPTRVAWENKEIVPQCSDIIWFTDGSKTDQGTGYGMYRLETGESSYDSVEATATVFQSEIQAISVCAKDMISIMQPEGRNIIIASDSQSALQALQENRITSHQIWECKNILNELGKSNDLKLVWVPGHCGILGNEMADELAKLGTTKEHPQGMYSCGVSMGLVKAEVKSMLIKEFITYFEQSKGMRQAKEFIWYNPKRTNELLALTKEQLRWTVGIFTGHGKFRYHLKKMKLINDDRCRFCGDDEEDAKHILCECEALMRKRKRILKAEFLEPRNIVKLKLSRIFEFLKQSGITESNER